MFTKLKNVLSGPDSEQPPKQPVVKEAAKYPYSRPHFLQLNDDEIQASIDHRLRPIISPSRKLANFSGYAECINGGKSKYNEDQAVTHQAVLASGHVKIPYTYFALFDGHAGVGAAICAANQLHHVLHQRLVDAQDDLFLKFLENEKGNSRHDLIIGALEMAFSTMDDIIKDELIRKQSNGGCTAIVAISILGSVYVANAGDSRAIICSGNNYKALSNDFTPETEKERIQQLAQMKPHLLGKYYTFIEYIRQPKMKDLGKRILFKDAFMKGWSYKTIVQEDLKPSLITGQGKRSRVMGTIGVTRGFGDHDLVSVYQRIPIKPFLSCHPEVQVLDLSTIKSQDVLVMGTDGLWDVLDGNGVSKIITDVMEIFDGRELYVSAATCLVGAARGTLKEHQWLMKNGKCASVDDISVFVIPLYSLATDHLKMRDTLDLEGLRLEYGVLKQENQRVEIMNRQDYVANIVEKIKSAQSNDNNQENQSDMCVITTHLDWNDKQLNFDVTGNLPSNNEQFLLINIKSIDDVQFSNNHKNQVKKIKRVRTRSFPGFDLANLQCNNDVKNNPSNTEELEKLVYTINLKTKKKVNDDIENDINSK